MSDRRRQEIESKRAKLAELRKARAERQRVDAEKRAPDVRTLYYIRTDVIILTLVLDRYLLHLLLGEI